MKKSYFLVLFITAITLSSDQILEAQNYRYRSPQDQNYPTTVEKDTRADEGARNRSWKDRDHVSYNTQSRYRDRHNPPLGYTELPSTTTTKTKKQSHPYNVNNGSNHNSRDHARHRNAYTHSRHHETHYDRKSTRHYEPFRRPRIGNSCHALPSGHARISHQSGEYYYYGGAFYSPHRDRGYRVIVPPRGLRVPYLADDYRVLEIGRELFFLVDGVVYRELLGRRGDRYYEVVGGEIW